MPSGLIGNPSKTVEYDSKCPKCKGKNIVRSNTYDLDELTRVSPVCRDCDFSWFECV